MTYKNPQKREQNMWVAAAKYSEIGFFIPAAIALGYGMGWLADRLLHTTWLYLVGVIFGAVAGFVTMIRRAMQGIAEDEKDEGSDEKH